MLLQIIRNRNIIPAVMMYLTQRVGLLLTGMAK
jgi:hypothetical protein